MGENQKQEILIRNREQVQLTGILGVDTFDSNTIVLSTVQGNLCLEGADLHIDQLQLEEHKMEISGNLQGLFFDKAKNKQGSKGKHILGRILK